MAAAVVVWRGVRCVGPNCTTSPSASVRDVSTGNGQAAVRSSQRSDGAVFFVPRLGRKGLAFGVRQPCCEVEKTVHDPVGFGTRGQQAR